MEAALAHEGPPVSLRAMAQRVSLASRTLRYYEPELCQHIVDRYVAYRTQRRDHMHHVLEHATQEDPPPSLVSLPVGHKYSFRENRGA